MRSWSRSGFTLLLMRPIRLMVAAAALGGVLVAPVQAYQLMQIRQVIGGVYGDTSAQAIQLTSRSVGQNGVSACRIRAWDATGANPVVLINMTSNVTNGASSYPAYILIASPNFSNYTSPAASEDFTMTNLIPASYLAAGRLTYEKDDGTVYWSLAWGNYTGSNSGSTSNDSDGNFGPPYNGPCPTMTTQGLRFSGSINDGSTTNAADYALTTGPAAFANNDQDSYSVVAPAATTITAWRSIKTHATAGALPIALNATASGNGSTGPTVESRSGGLEALQVDFAASVFLTSTPTAGVSTFDGTINYPPVSVSAVDSNTIQINYPPMSAAKCYSVSIFSGVVTRIVSGDLNCRIRVLAGDTTGDGKVTLGDVLFTKTRLGTTAAANPRLDYQLDGHNIDSLDLIAIKGQVARPAKQVTCP